MMTKRVMIGLAASVVAVSLNAEPTNAELLEKIESMQKQIEQFQSNQDDNYDEFDERIDGVETATLTDKIDFGVEFRTRVDFFEGTEAGGADYSDNNIWSNRLRLNMGAKIADNMKFTGRLSMYKNWADSNINMFSNMDPMQGRRPNDSSLFVERAYVDWTLFKGDIPLVLTIGRQPSSDGPSHQFKDNTVRKSTYSALSFDGAADGIVATIPLNKISGIDGMAVRLGYGKGFQDSSSMSYVGNPNGIADSNVMGLFFDSGLGMEGSLLQLSAVQATDVVSNVPGDNKNIGDIVLYTAMLEFTNIAQSNLDLFAHYAISQSKPNGEYSLMNPGTVPGPDNPPLGLLTSTPGDTKQKNGAAFWIGARYTVEADALNNPRIGAEYNQGDNNWFSFTQGSNDLTNKLATRGSAAEVYYIQPINRYAFLRLGAQMIDYKYTGSGYQIGAPMEVSDMNGGALDKLDNYYLLFNMAY